MVCGGCRYLLGGCPVVERDNYAWPKECESWSDAKAADFERECDCEDIENLALWDSETDVERIPLLVVARRIDNIKELDAWVDGDRIAVSPRGLQKGVLEDYIESVEGFPCDEVRWVSSDDSVNTAWYEIR